MSRAKKSLGQNFLIDKNIIKKIVNLVKIKDQNIIEIGPGKGALTNEILKKYPKTFSIIEKDNNLVKQLRNETFLSGGVNILNNDILKFDLEKILSKNCVIIGNLPYNISSQILVKILSLKSWPPKYSNLIFMFQKELGEKIIGKFKSKSYGRLSILTNYNLIIKNKFLVSNNCFFPKPKITSIVIHFQPKKNRQIRINNIKNLEKVTNFFFSNKRKMINKNIKKLLSKNEIKKLKDLNLTMRPSEISPETYYKITQLIEAR